MLRLLGRRAGVQWALLVAVVLVVAAGATLLGLCALLLTSTQEQALDTGVSRAAPRDVELTAFAAGVRPGTATAVAADMRGVVVTSLAPFTATTAVRASTAMRRLDPGTGAPRRVAYLSGVEGLPEVARLVAGRWPRPGSTAGRGPAEAVVLESTARRLGLTPGRRVTLGPEVPPALDAAAVHLRVVGVISPLPDTGWDRDPLVAKGFDPAYFDGIGLRGVAAYGPFVIPLPGLLAGGSTVERLQVTGRPDLSAPSGRALGSLDAATAAADGRLARGLGLRVQTERVGSSLPAVLGLARAQQAVTASTLLVVAVIGAALTAAALGLAGRLVTGLRAEESALLSSFGAGRAQLGALAAAEAVLVAAVAALVAVPASTAAHAGLTRLPALARAGLTTPPQVRAGQVVTVVVGALLFAAILVVPALFPTLLDATPARAARGRAPLLVRSGADAVLLALAVAGWWQLRAQPAGQLRTDAVRVVAPVVCLLAGAALMLRLVTVPLRAADRLARGSRGLLLPLAVFEAARRPRAVATGLLLALASASGAFALVLGTTWDRSQQDQADARVGTDLSLVLTGEVAAGQGAAIAAATGGQVAPVTDRSVVVGQYVGDATDSAVRLIAVDASRAGVLLRGRVGSGGWARVGGRLRAGDDVAAAPVGGSPLSVTGTSPRGSRLLVTPRLVLQDRQGLRVPCDLPAVPLDGRAHRLSSCPAAAGTALVAAQLQIDLDPALAAARYAGAAGAGAAGAGTGRMQIALSVPGERPGPAAGSWSATPAREDPQPLTDTTADMAGTPSGTVIHVHGSVATDQLGLYQQPASLVVSGFRPPPVVPVAVSRRLAGTLGARLGRRLTIAVGGTAVAVVVAQVVPAVPAAPGQAAMLADADTLSRALIAGGRLEPAVDSWWVGRPSRPASSSRLEALGLGTVTSRTEVAATLRRGPLTAGFPAALAVLVASAVLLVLAGTLMHVISDVQARGPEVARLRAIGLPRRGVLAGLLLQYCGVLALMLAGGGVAGVLVSRVVAPLLVRSDVGAAPVPPVLISWPWRLEAGLMAVLLLGGTLVASVAIVVQAGRADAAYLRVAT